MADLNESTVAGRTSAERTYPPISARELKLIHSFVGDHLYLLREIVGNDKNAYKYVKALEEKGLIEQTSDPGHLGVDPLTHGARMTRVQLTERGRTLRELVERIELRRKFESTDFLFLTENDAKLLATVAAALAPLENMNDLAKASGIPLTSLYSSLTRLRALDLLNHNTYRPTEDGLVLGQFISEGTGLQHDLSANPLLQTPVVTSGENRLTGVEDLVITTRHVLQNMLFITPRDTSESILIIADKHNHHIGTIFAYACEMLGVEPVVLMIPDIREAGTVPPIVEQAIEQATVLIAATSKSITYSDPVVRNVRKGKLRAATMPAATIDILRDALVVDPHRLQEIRHTTERFARILRSSRRLELLTSDGTSLIAERELDDPVVCEFGMCSKVPDTSEPFPSFGITNLIGGEVFVVPRRVEGTLTVSSLVSRIGAVKETFRVHVANSLGEVEGDGEAARRFAEILNHSEKSRELSSFNFGTNPFVKLKGARLSDAKVRGGVNVGFGNNSFVYGHNDETTVHMCLIEKSCLILDRRRSYRLDATQNLIEGPGFDDGIDYIQ